MNNFMVKAAFDSYRAGDFGGALFAYHKLATEINHKLFFANIALCISKLSCGTVGVFSNAHVLQEGLGGEDLLAELYGDKVVVSLTSYPARINAVSETIRSLLSQSFCPGQVILWLASAQFPGLEKDLPADLLALKKSGLSIKWCDDLRSYKKLIPTLIDYPDKIIVTADDDIVYGKYWLSQLLITHIQYPKAIVCHRAHQVSLDQEGDFLPYKRWLMDVKFENPSLGYLFTGCGGVLYPPNSLHCSVLDRHLFSTLCPHGDDLWFWCMAVINGTKVKIVKNSEFKLDFVPGTQETALWMTNVQEGGNDAMLRALRDKYPEVVESVSEERKSVASNEIKVSVIVPVFNTGQYLTGCLDSILNQSFKSLEVLCVDDGSTDTLTKEILSAYAKRDSRIRVIRQENSGPATARNNGLRCANGEYISFIDSDDYVSEDFVYNLYECAHQSKLDISVAKKIYCVNENGDLAIKKSGFELYGKLDPKHSVAQAIVTTGVSCNKLYRKSFLIDNGVEYLHGMRCQSEDNYFSILAMVLGYKKVAIAQGAIYYYRQHDKGITKNITRDSFEKSVAVYVALQDKIKSLSVSDKVYWVNVLNQRAFRDLRYSSSCFEDAKSVEDMLVEKFKISIDICCIADVNYVEPTMVFLESVKRTKRKLTLPSITILVPEGAKNKMEILERMNSKDFLVKIREVDATRFEGLHKYKEDKNFCMASPSAMFKFIIPEVFPDLDRILYIDTDLIVRKDLQELFMTAMDGFYLCAVPDLWTPVTDRDDIKRFKVYFNSGMMLMNLSNMRDAKLPEKLIEAKIKSTNFNLMDQDVFNEVCSGNVKVMDIKYNFLPVCYKRHKHRFDLKVVNSIYESSYLKIEEIAADPVVAHWAGSDKPWVTTSTLFSDEWVVMFDSLKARGLVSGQLYQH